MAAITVKIEKSEDGQFMVGIDTADQDGSVEGLMKPEAGNMPKEQGMGMPMQAGQQKIEATEDTGLNPATDLEDALNQARALLAGPQTEQQAFAAA